VVIDMARHARTLTLAEYEAQSTEDRLMDAALGALEGALSREPNDWKRLDALVAALTVLSDKLPPAVEAAGRWSQ
jgi:hypothetical protein